MALWNCTGRGNLCTGSQNYGSGYIHPIGSGKTFSNTIYFCFFSSFVSSCQFRPNKASLAKLGICTISRQFQSHSWQFQTHPRTFSFIETYQTVFRTAITHLNAKDHKWSNTKNKRYDYTYIMLETLRIWCGQIEISISELAYKLYI